MFCVVSARKNMISFYCGFVSLLMLNIASSSKALPKNVSQHVGTEPKIRPRLLPVGVYPVLIVDETKRHNHLDPKVVNTYHKNKNNSKRNHVLNTDYMNSLAIDARLTQNSKTDHTDVDVPKSNNNTRSTNAKVSAASIKYAPATDSIDKPKIEEEMGYYYDTLYNAEDYSEEYKETRKDISSDKKDSNPSKFSNNVSPTKLIAKENDRGTESSINNTIEIVPEVSKYKLIQTKANSVAPTLKNNEHKNNSLSSDVNDRNNQLLNSKDIIEFATNLHHNNNSGGHLPAHISKYLFKYLLNILLSNYMLDKPSNMSSILSVLDLGKYAEQKANPGSNSRKNRTKSFLYGFNVTHQVTLPRNVLTVINTGNISDLNATLTFEGHNIILNNKTLAPGVHFVNANISNVEYIETVADMITRSFVDHDLGTFGKKAKKKIVKAVIKKIAHGMIFIINSGTISGLNLNLINTKNCDSKNPDFESTNSKGQTTNKDSDDDDKTSESDSPETIEEIDCTTTSTVNPNGSKNEHDNVRKNSSNQDSYIANVNAVMMKMKLAENQAGDLMTKTKSATTSFNRDVTSSTHRRVKRDLELTLPLPPLLGLLEPIILERASTWERRSYIQPSNNREVYEYPDEIPMELDSKV